jgi:hypothetical protein
MNHMAMPVGKHLHFHMTRVHDGTLHQQVTIAEASQGFGTCTVQSGMQLLGTFHQPHAAPAATGHGLDHDGVANHGCFVGKARIALVIAFIARQTGHAMGLGQLLGGGLAAELADRGRRRANPDQARFLNGLGKAGILAEKAVAG